MKELAEEETQKPLQEGEKNIGVAIAKQIDKEIWEAHPLHPDNLPTPLSVDEIIKEVEKCFLTERMTDWPVPTVRVNPDTLKSIVQSLLTSFEAHIRADEADTCDKHIKIARQTIYKELIDAIEGEKMAFTFDVSDKKSFLEGYNEAIKKATQIIKQKQEE